MSWFGSLFRAKRPKPFGPPPRDVESLTASAAVPAIHLIGQEAVSRSHLGGTPELPPDFVWPSHQGKPLSFLACLELAQLHQALRIDWLPPNGALLFFYDLKNHPWGYDPKNRDSWSVVHLPEGGPDWVVPKTQSISLPRLNVRPKCIRTLPSWEREPILALSLTDEESDLYLDLTDKPYGDAAQHQIGGFPSPVQGDEMELQCQLTSHGLFCGDSTGYNSPEAQPLKAGAADWRLLLQIDSDDDLEVMWGDLGKLYFWIQESTARQADFSNAWVVLQCS